MNTETLCLATRKGPDRTQYSHQDLRVHLLHGHQVHPEVPEVRRGRLVQRVQYLPTRV